jgi:hypothetical protein
VIAADRNYPSLQTVDLGGDLLGRQFVIFGVGFRQRLNLVLGEERRFVLQLQVGSP